MELRAHTRRPGHRRQDRAGARLPGHLSAHRGAQADASAIRGTQARARPLPRCGEFGSAGARPGGRIVETGGERPAGAAGARPVGRERRPGGGRRGSLRAVRPRARGRHAQVPAAHGSRRRWRDRRRHGYRTERASRRAHPPVARQPRPRTRDHARPARAVRDREHRRVHGLPRARAEHRVERPRAGRQDLSQDATVPLRDQLPGLQPDLDRAARHYRERHPAGGEGRSCLDHAPGPQGARLGRARSRSGVGRLVALPQRAHPLHAPPGPRPKECAAGA